MSLIIVRARVCHLPEAQIDAQLLNELDEPTPYVAWRKIAIRSEEISDLEQYDKDKCLIIKYTGEDPLLINEPFSKVKKKWDMTKKHETSRITTEDNEEEDENENDGDDDL